MTFDERVEALASLGLTPRQTRFLVTVALHSGYCLRRQYTTFAGVQYGKNVRDFLDGLVDRRLAERFSYRTDRGHVYHLHARRIYRALGQDDNRNRRHASAALIARKLMLLDYVLSEPAVEWFATEDDKRALFTERLRLSAEDLPQRLYRSEDGNRGATVRFFIHKLPIYLAGDPPAAHFVYLVTDRSVRAFEQFLLEHARLFRRLSSWAVALISPRDLGSTAVFESAFNRFRSGGAADLAARRDELIWYFEMRRAVEHADFKTLSVEQINRFREVRGKHVGIDVERLYTRWCHDGETALSSFFEKCAGTADRQLRGQLIRSPLPFAYDRFGSLAGVC